MAGFKIGDLLRLQSGGRTMTVEETAGASVTGVWSHREEMNYQVFKAGALQPQTPVSIGSV